MTIDLTDPDRITGSVVAWTVAGYVAVFLLALAVASMCRRLDGRRGRGKTNREARDDREDRDRVPAPAVR